MTKKANDEFNVDLDDTPRAAPPVRPAEVIEAGGEAPPVIASVGPTREEIDRIRATRQPLSGGVGRLHVHGELPGYHLHIFKDQGTRLAMAEQAGYAFVQRGEGGLQVGRDVSSLNTDPGNRVRFVMGTVGSEPLYGYLMKIPTELHDEDMARNEAELQQVDAQIRGGLIGETTDQQRYVPKSGIQYDPGVAKLFRPTK